jgi:hypothetical protein
MTKAEIKTALLERYRSKIGDAWEVLIDGLAYEESYGEGPNHNAREHFLIALTTLRNGHKVALETLEKMADENDALPPTNSIR